MKNNKILSLGLLMTGLVLIFMGCEPIEEDRDYLENTIDLSAIQLVSSQSTPGGNKITLNMVTPGVNGYWDYNLGKAIDYEAEFVYPIPGMATFTFVGTLGAEFFAKTIEVQIDQLDHALDQDWYDLVSEDTSGGKTWVFNGGPSADGGLWWYMSADNDPSAWGSPWWNAAGDCCPPSDAAGRMKFDLDGAANFTYYSGPDASPQVGDFVLDVAKQTLKINNGNILGGNKGNSDRLYTIISLTEDELILYVPMNPEDSTGWTWIFRPE